MIRHLLVTTAVDFLRVIAFAICLATFSGGITQNNPSPLAIAVLTNPGRISVTHTPVFLDFLRRACV